MPNKASLLLGLSIMIGSGWAVYTAAGWPWKAALFPMVIGIPVFCMAAVEVLWTLFGSTSRGEVMDFQMSSNLPDKVTLVRTLEVVGWMLGFLGAIVLISFPVAVPLFVFLYLKLQGREGWGWSLGLTLAVWGLFHGLFERMLHLPFPDGLIQTWAGLS